MMKDIRFEPSILGASLYYKDQFICNVSGMEDAERLKQLLSNKGQRLDDVETALKELVEAVLNMEVRKQKEVIHFARKVLERESD
ncbi:MAG: hypothetical protein N2484_17080 [Clostridia bacterium]|nr:hypothetical protein [Clostridia bacterium]